MDKSVILVLATRNKGKTEEIRALLSGFPVTLKNLDDFGPIAEVVEDGDTFDDNAYKKASFTARVLGFPAIADDSGLVVEALNGEPGVYSARYAGEDADDAANNAKLLEQMAGVEDRRAAFQCVLSIAMPTGQALTYEGRCDGVIAQAPSGEGGFGYDPLFYCPDKGKTFAELTMEEKGEISHRGRALKEVADEFDKVLTWIDMHTPMQERFECKG
ncbi:XTP/dITP diphosphatase [Desulfoluna spongiiphila]|uniref:dITP/XTP pyrophosphatase n=2 Tax=Desulfoluna spongiiphila TaxID=419481 RepID=A0A1G5GGZ6_9BACT|nr:XTP/dITP diphosphatase [Desulfoluna spongiiphila]SCY50815.1 XTP/dITP diphosphohydrolase [Desulfoluna spongiiphila]